MFRPRYEPGSSRIPVLPLDSDFSPIDDVDAAVKPAGKERDLIRFKNKDTYQECNFNAGN